MSINKTSIYLMFFCFVLQISAFSFVHGKEKIGFESFSRHSVNNDNFPSRPILIKNDKIKKNFEIDFKILILSAEENEKVDPGLQAAISFLQNMWIPYDVIILTKNGQRDEDKKLVLLNPDGSAKYSGIITTEYNLSYKSTVSEETQYTSALTTEEWQLLFDYERKFNVRHLSLFTYPQKSAGVIAVPNADHFKTNYVTFEKNILHDYSEGYNLNLEIPIIKNWHYPVTESTHLIGEKLSNVRPCKQK